MKFVKNVQHMRQISRLTLETSRSMFKVICFRENDPPATDMLKGNTVAR